MLDGMKGAALLGAVVIGLGCQSASAQSSSNNRDKIFRSQFAYLDKISSQYSYSERLVPQTDWNGVLAIPNAKVNSKFRRQYLPVAQAAARRHGVPEALFVRLVQQESGWNPGAISPKGAIGLAQLMPDTARLLGVDASSPAENLDGGARYLKTQYDRFGSWRLALAAYNAGPEAVASYNDVPPYRETQGYVQAILAGMG